MSNQSATASERYPIYDVPMALEDSLTCTAGLDPGEAKIRAKNHAEHAKTYVLGPMPVGKFLDQFIPDGEGGSGKRGGRLSSRHAFRSVPSSAASSSNVREKLMEALTRTTKNKARCPGLTFIAATPSGHVLPYNPLYIDCISSENVVSAQQSRNVLGFTEFFFDIHPDPSADYFADSQPDHDEHHWFIPKIEDSDMCRRRDRAWGQHIERVAEIMARQHRVFAYSVTIFGSRARLLRWDRAGCIVSEAFDTHETPDPLCEFLWRFSQVSDAGRGHDLTIEKATPEEEELFHAAVREYVRQQLNVEGAALDRAVKEHYAPGHVAATHVTVADSEKQGSRVLRLVISRPVVSPLSPASRGTRGYWAYDTASRVIMFLKDHWRSVGQTETEDTILLNLNNLCVRNVPEAIGGSDVTDTSGEPQSTLADNFVSCTWVTPNTDNRRLSVAKLVHYRLVSATVGYGLRRFKGTSELLHGAYDAFQAMQDARRLDSRLHRDISLENIILVRVPGQTMRRGYLIDWELSSRVDANGESIDLTRTGTWLFMASKLLRKTRAPHRLNEDMESLLYVVLFAGLRWLPHNLGRAELHQLIWGLFVRSTGRNVLGLQRGGDAKLTNMHIRAYTEDLKFTNRNFHHWITAVMDLHAPVDPHAKLGGPPLGAPDLWNDPSHLEAFWSKFLQTRSLPNNDRTYHVVSEDDEYSYRRSDTRSPSPGAPSAGSSGKRSLPSESEQSDLEPPSKRSRISGGHAPPDSRPAPGPPSRALASAPTAPPSPRRLRARGADGKTLRRAAAPDESRRGLGPVTRRELARQKQAKIGVRSGQRRTRRVV